MLFTSRSGSGFFDRLTEYSHSINTGEEALLAYRYVEVGATDDFSRLVKLEIHYAPYYKKDCINNTPWLVSSERGTGEYMEMENKVRWSKKPQRLYTRLSNQDFFQMLISVCSNYTDRLSPELLAKLQSVYDSVNEPIQL